MEEQGRPGRLSELLPSTDLHLREDLPSAKHTVKFSSEVSLSWLQNNSLGLKDDSSFRERIDEVQEQGSLKKSAVASNDKPRSYQSDKISDLQSSQG